MVDLNESPLTFGMKALAKALDEITTEKAWELYLVLLPNWDSKDRLGFSDFLEKVKRSNVNVKVTTITDKDLERYSDIADLRRHEKG